MFACAHVCNRIGAGIILHENIGVNNIYNTLSRDGYIHNISINCAAKLLANIMLS